MRPGLPESCALPQIACIMTSPLKRLPAHAVAALCLGGVLSLLPIAARAAGQSATACDASGTGPYAPRLHVVVTGVHRVAGNVTFTLYGDDPSRFLAHHGALKVLRTTLTGSTAEACFAVSAPGTYAVAVYHDENDNHRFDRTLLGLPAEGYGFSNNVTPLFGLPSFGSVRMTIAAGDTRISIKLLY
jgi:uncharacterized protein (DUF2141 family)